MPKRNNLERRLRAIVEAGMREVGKPLPRYVPKRKPLKKAYYARPRSSNPNHDYAAGILVGEGGVICMKPTYKGKIYTYPALAIHMCDLKAITHVAQTLFQKKVTRGRESECKRTPQNPEGRGYRAVVVGKAAHRVMNEIEPTIKDTELWLKWRELLKRCR